MLVNQAPRMAEDMEELKVKGTERMTREDMGGFFTLVSGHESCGYLSGPQSKLKIAPKWMNSWGALPFFEVLVMSLSSLQWLSQLFKSYAQPPA